MTLVDSAKSSIFYVSLIFGEQKLEGQYPNCSKMVYLDSIKVKRVTRIICPHCMGSYPVIFKIGKVRGQFSLRSVLLVEMEFMVVIFDKSSLIIV